MFPMTPNKGREIKRLARSLTRGAGWGCREPALNSHMKLTDVKSGGTGEAPNFNAGYS